MRVNLIKSQHKGRHPSRFQFITFAWAAVLLAGLYAGCSKPLTQTVIGRWIETEIDGKPAEPDHWMEFFSDGTFAMKPDPSSALAKMDSLQGTYTLSEEGRLKINLKIFFIDTLKVGQVSRTDDGDLLIDWQEDNQYIHTRWKRSRMPVTEAASRQS